MITELQFKSKCNEIMSKLKELAEKGQTSEIARLNGILNTLLFVGGVTTELNI